MLPCMLNYRPCGYSAKSTPVIKSLVAFLKHIKGNSARKDYLAEYHIYHHISSYHVYTMSLLKTCIQKYIVTFFQKQKKKKV